MISINDNIKKAIKIAEKANEEKIFIPLIDGFTIKTRLENGFLAANAENFTEQFVTSSLKGTFDELIENDIKSAINYSKNHGITVDEKNIKYYGEYNYSFKFKLYFKDIVIDDKSFIRNLDAYFINKKNNTFNIISISTCPLDLKSSILLEKISNIENDKFVKYLLESMEIIIKNIK